MAVVALATGISSCSAPARLDHPNAVPYSFLKFPVHDLRTVLDKPDKIVERERSGMCLVLVLGIPLGPMVMPRGNQQVRVTNDSTVRSVLDLAGIKNWAGGQPQLRLVARDFIIQSPLGGTRHRRDDVERFLNAVVSPGDIVVIARVE